MNGTITQNENGAKGDKVFKGKKKERKQIDCRERKKEKRKKQSSRGGLVCSRR